MPKKRVSRNTRTQTKDKMSAHHSRISHTIFIILILAIVLIGFGSLLSQYDSEITGRAISPAFNIEEVQDAETPTVAALLTARDHKLVEDKLSTIESKDGSITEVTPSSNPPKQENTYLYLQWSSKVEVISLYMRGTGGSPYFELWTKDDVLIASGILTSEFRWYNFDVSSELVDSEFYALYNYDWGGEGNIQVDNVLAQPTPKPSFAAITGL